MLKTRILTASVLGLILLTGLFFVPAAAATVAFGAVFTIGIHLRVVLSSDHARDQPGYPESARAPMNWP